MVMADRLGRVYPFWIVVGESCFDHKRIRWGFFRVKLGERRTVVHLEGGGIEFYMK